MRVKPAQCRAKANRGFPIRATSAGGLLDRGYLLPTDRLRAAVNALLAAGGRSGGPTGGVAVVLPSDTIRLLFVVTVKPDSPVGPSSCMSPLKSPTQVRTELSALIAEAVLETDDARRHGLLVLADHWSDILRRRKTANERVHHA